MRLLAVSSWKNIDTLGGTMKDFKKLHVWQRAHKVTLMVYRATLKFPKSETYALVGQMRRSSSSIATNIAEGCGRNGDAELGRFLIIAMGSASELEYQLLLARDLGYFQDAEYDEVQQELLPLRKMLNVLVHKLLANSH
jgi:four helix bundle protein